jgi:hypothetical protein
MKFLNLLLVVSAAQAFSLGSRVRDSRLVQRSASDSIASFTNKLQHSSPTYLQQAVSAEVEVVAKAAPSSSLIDKIWNEQTKLGFYLAVWYLGNIYYNIYNKKACIALGKNAAGGSNLHWMLSAVQVKLIILFHFINT